MDKLHSSPFVFFLEYKNEASTEINWANLKENTKQQSVNTQQHTFKNY